MPNTRVNSVGLSLPPSRIQYSSISVSWNIQRRLSGGFESNARANHTASDAAYRASSLGRLPICDQVLGGRS